jgi:hypothetical protein
LKRKLAEAKLKHSQGVDSNNKHVNLTDKSVTKEFLQERATSMAREANKVPPVENSVNRPFQQRFTGMSVSDLLFVEIFAGTARLSKHAREAGMRVLPVDKTTARSSQIYIAQYDITDQHQFESLMQVLASEADRIAAVHLAPACGTASKAREKKLLSCVRKGFKVPVPLRSTQKPMGVDNLSGLDKIRTELANQVYEKTAAIMKFCIEADILCSLENPENSPFLDVPGHSGNHGNMRWHKHHFLKLHARR